MGSEWLKILHEVIKLAAKQGLDSDLFYCKLQVLSSQKL